MISAPGELVQVQERGSTTDRQQHLPVDAVSIVVGRDAITTFGDQFGQYALGLHEEFWRKWAGLKPASRGLADAEHIAKSSES